MLCTPLAPMAGGDHQSEIEGPIGARASAGPQGHPLVLGLEAPTRYRYIEGQGGVLPRLLGTRPHPDT